MDIKTRVRKVDLNQMNVEQAEAISEQIGIKIREICDKAIEDANKLLSIYGLSAKMQIVIEGQEMVKEVKVPKKRVSKKQKNKEANL